MTNPTPCDQPAQPYTAEDGFPADPYAAAPFARPIGWAPPPVPEPTPYAAGQTFWMVYVQGRSTPAKQHYDYNDALAEADRLAHKEFGRAVYILLAVRYCRVQEPPVVWHECRAERPAPVSTRDMRE